MAVYFLMGFKKKKKDYINPFWPLGIGLLGSILVHFRLCLAICKIFSKSKIFSVENILRKGKHFLLFDCVVEITLENYF